jgi:type II restriction/modification system DNA methylase subunit YeeA
MFERISDYSELLFPNGMLKKDSVIARMVENIPEEDWKDQVQIIGWMYQFYIAKKKTEVFASKKTVTKDTIAAVTQLFTPDWIVRYMTENSIGRIWLEAYPDSPLREQLKYFVDGSDQPDEVKKKLDEIRYKDVDPKDIKVIEPCCGSGHILVYCFDVLFKIYLEKGYLNREIPSLILQNNLTGLDIDKRASQLASFSLIMKARSYDSGFFRRAVFPKIFEIEDTSSINLLDLSNDFEKAGFSKEASETAQYLAETFRDGKVIGSLLKVQPRNYDYFASEIKEKISNAQTVDLFEQDFYSTTLPKLIYISKLADALSKKYDVMITNPPYIGISTLEASAKNYAAKYYPNSKTDMFAMFMETDFVKKNGFLAMINMHSWMFLGSFEKLRLSLLKTKEIVTMAHLGARAFETIGGEVVQTTTFVLRNCRYNGNGVYFRLVDSSDKENDFLTANCLSGTAK